MQPVRTLLTRSFPHRGEMRCKLPLSPSLDPILVPSASVPATARTELSSENEHFSNTESRATPTCLPDFRTAAPGTLDHPQKGIGSFVAHGGSPRAVQREIESDDVDSWLSQQTKIAGFGVFGDHGSHGLLSHAAAARDPSRLQAGIGDADVRVQPAAGGRDGVGRNQSRAGQFVFRAVGGHTLGDHLY